MFTDNTTKVDSEPSNGSNDDITNSYEGDLTLNVSAGTTNLSADDICSHQFRPRSSSIDDICSHQFRPRSLVTKWRLLITLQALFLKRKEKCTLQCALSSEEEKSSCF
ncbi:hypothetical protein Tco_0254467 [Tanacetum coccineum]